MHKYAHVISVNRQLTGNIFPLFLLYEMYVSYDESLDSQLE